MGRLFRGRARALGTAGDITGAANGTLTTHRYAYDLQGRLTEVRRNGTLVEQYTYDVNGNRLSLTTPDGTTTGTYDDQDRLLTYGKWTYTYTDNGELRSKTDTETGEVTTYAYDALGNLLAVALPDGKLVEYAVDGRGRRISRNVDGVVTNRWLYKDQLNPVAELDRAGNLVARYVYGSKRNVPDVVVRYDGGTTKTYRVISDHLGSPRMAVNVADASDMPFTAEYSAFGEVSGTRLEWMPFGFAGGRFDPDTGLVRFGVRAYDPKLGRWTSKDPIRFDGGMNLYVYAANDPANQIDVTGFDPMRDPFSDPFITSEEAADSAEHKFGGTQGGHNGPGDAYRHCVASCWLAQRWGAAYAWFFGQLNEATSGNPPEESKMDSHNNMCGRSYGRDAETDCSLSCLGAALNGELITLE